MKINTYPSAWDLKYFQELAMTKNFSRAAERLGIGQPTLSLAIQRLEKAMQSKLFLRRNRNLQLTPAGNHLLQQSHQLLKFWDDILTKNQNSESERKGTFRLGCHASVGGYSLPKALSKIFCEEPGIQFQMEHGLSRVMVEQVVSGDIDFAIAVNPVRHPDLVIFPLAKDEVCFWKTIEAPDDILLCDPQLLQSQQLLKKLGTKIHFSKSLYSTSLEFIRSLAAEGVGTAILPTRIAKQAGERLKRCGSLPSFTDEISFVYRKDILRTAASSYLIAEFRKLKL